MKLPPPPPDRPLTDDERLFLALERTKPQGVSAWATARRLMKLGLGEIKGREFVTNERGRGAI